MGKKHENFEYKSKIQKEIRQDTQTTTNFILYQIEHIH